MWQRKQREAVIRFMRRTKSERSKGVKVEVTEEHVSVNMALNLKYGYSIPDVCEKVQEKVKSAIENMTGLTVLDVNIKIAGVSMEEK